MNNRKKIIGLLIILLITALSIFYVFFNEDEKTSLTLPEKKWIESNKNNLIDLSIINGIPVLNENGNGLIFDFLSTLEDDTGLEFNKLLYNSNSEATSDYAIKTNSNSKNDILFYEDNYVIVTKNKVYYNDVDELKDLTLGVLKDDLIKVSNYLEGSSNLVYKDFASFQEALSSVNEGTVDGAIVPKLNYLEYILKNKLHIAYNINEYSKNYYIALGSNKKLNRILTKYFKKYKKEKYEESLNKHFSDSYFTFKKIDESTQTDFRSKRYSFGFVTDAPFMVSINSSLKGFNHALIKSFGKMANVEVDFKRYSNLKNELDDFNSNNLDFIFSNVDVSKYKMDVYKTVPIYNNKVSVITKGNMSLSINNVSSFSGLEVSVLKNSNTEKYLKTNNIKVKGYDTTMDLINNLSGNEIAIIDDYNYDYYVRREFKDIKRIKSLDFDSDFGFVCRDINDNKVFNDFLSFYLSFTDTQGIINKSYEEVLYTNDTIKSLQIILSILVMVLLSVTLFLTFKLFKRKKRYDVRLSKSDKLRYIDSLTSLKNRNYLNDNISKWDSSDVYPQSVIIVDLNNVAYINDNFGHAEGDKIIAAGAGVLINNQLKDSEILRTNGNEFLVFTIGHDEKTIVTYIRKLNKELKELPHGFGAAIGYSMIFDEIKTIDDAINEATIDMRNNKEEVN